MKNSIDIYINPKLVPILNTKKRYIVVYGGRSSGKSWGIADILLIKSFTEPNINILCAKGTMRSISDSVKALLEQSIVKNKWDDYFYITDKEIVCKITKSKFIFSGLQHPNRLKSMENIKYLWIEEGTVDVTQEALDVLPPTIFRVKGSQIFITFNPRLNEDPVYKMFILNSHPDAVVIKMNYYDNPWLTDEVQKEIELDKHLDLIKYNHIWLGELIDETKGALWNKDLILHEPLDDDIEFDKVTVSIDPSTTDKSTSDACGLIVVGKIDGTYWVLDEATAIMSPKKWAHKAISLYHKWGANHIIYESNQGGDMVKTIINSIDSTIRGVPINARGRKITRAEEILYLYEQSKVYHRKYFKTLEYEMLTFTGDKKDKSPNSLDALVHGLKDISPSRNIIPRGYVPASKSSMRMGTMTPTLSRRTM